MMAAALLKLGNVGEKSVDEDACKGSNDSFAHARVQYDGPV
jgi:hypothetical protein